MSLESIRKIWVLIGTLLATLSLDFIPQVVLDLFQETGTGLVFGFLGAAAALFQFVKARTGQQKEPQQYSTGEKSKALYWLPWIKA